MHKVNPRRKSHTITRSVSGVGDAVLASDRRRARVNSFVKIHLPDIISGVAPTTTDAIQHEDELSSGDGDQEWEVESSSSSRETERTESKGDSWGDDLRGKAVDEGATGWLPSISELKQQLEPILKPKQGRRPIVVGHLNDTIPSSHFLPH